MLVCATIRVGEDSVTRLLTLFIAFAFGLVAAAAPVPRERVSPDEKAVKKQFYQCWHEAWLEERSEDGIVRVESRPWKLAAYEFDENGGWIWDWSGELSPVG